MKLNKTRRDLKEAILHVSILSLVIASIVYFTANLELIGLILIIISILPLISLKLTGEKIGEAISEIVFGAFNTGLISLMAIGGFALEGIFGAIVGVVAGDAITEGFSGILEGEMTEILMKKGIKEKNDPLISSLGKMAGALLGGGIVLIIFSLI